VRGHLPLARHLAGRDARGLEPFDDLFQVACLGLIKAIDRYDPERGTNFSSYAVPTITGELKRHFRDRTWVVRVPHSVHDVAMRVRAATEGLTPGLGHDDAGYRRVEQRAEIEDLLSCFTPRERNVMRLRFEKDLTQQEISDRLGVV
jgi:RNA polymerase sigma-B factor